MLAIKVHVRMAGSAHMATVYLQGAISELGNERSTASTPSSHSSWALCTQRTAAAPLKSSKSRDEQDPVLQSTQNILLPSFDASWTCKRCCTRTSSRSTPATPPTSRGRIQSSSERCVSMSRSLCAGLIRVSSTHALYSSPLINRTFHFLLFDAS